MKHSAFILATLFATLSALAAAPQLYAVRCPSCLADQKLPAQKVLLSGVYTTTRNGVPGAMQQSTGLFKCGLCKQGRLRHTRFQAPIKPDKFVPAAVATPIPATQ